MTGIWLRQPRTARANPPLTRDRIVAEAVTLLDEAGVSGLTMRRLAERLGAGPTTLYWHVATKDDVIDLALDRIFGEVPLPEAPAADWRTGVRAIATGWYAAMLRHPWSAPLIGRPLLGPNVLARTEHLQAALVRSGLTEPHLSAATHALANYVIGSALTRSTWQLADPETRRAAQAHLADQDDRYPTLVAHGHLDDRDEDATFAHGLTYLLDGFAPQPPARDLPGSEPDNS